MDTSSSSDESITTDRVMDELSTHFNELSIEPQSNAQSVHHVFFINRLRFPKYNHILRIRMSRYQRNNFRRFKKRVTIQTVWKVVQRDKQVKFFMYQCPFNASLYASTTDHYRVMRMGDVEKFKRRRIGLPASNKRLFWNTHRGAIFLTNTVCFGAKQYEVTSGRVDLIGGNFCFTMKTNEMCEDDEPECFKKPDPGMRISIPLEHIRDIVITDPTESSGAVAVMFLVSAELFASTLYQIQFNYKHEEEIPGPNFEDYYTLVFEVPYNYYVDNGDYHNLMVHYTYWLRVLNEERTVKKTESVAYFNEVLSDAGVYLQKVYDIFGHANFIFSPLPKYPLPQVKALDEYQPIPTKSVSIELPEHTIEFLETDLIDIVSRNVLNGKVIDIYLNEIRSRLPIKDQNRILIISHMLLRMVCDLTQPQTLHDATRYLSKPCTVHDDIFKKDFCIIPFQSPSHWMVALVVNPGALIDGFEYIGRIPTAILISTVWKKPFPDFITHFLRFQFNRLKDNGMYAESVQYHGERLRKRCIGDLPRENAQDSGVYMLQLLEQNLNPLPEVVGKPKVSCKLDFYPEMIYRSAIHAAIWNKVNSKRYLRRERLRFPVAEYTSESAKQRSEHAIAVWNHMLKVKGAESNRACTCDCCLYNG